VAPEFSASRKNESTLRTSLPSTLEKDETIHTELFLKTKSYMSNKGRTGTTEVFRS